MLGKGKIRNTYTDSKYAYLVLHAHATLQKETGLYLTLWLLPT